MDSTLACLREWMPRQRWYAGKGGEPALRRVAEWDLGGTADAQALVLLVADTGGSDLVLYQVPVVRRRTPVGNVIGRTADGFVVEGTGDPLFQERVYDWLRHGGRVSGADGPLTAEPAAPVHGRRHGRARATVLEGEQSNTSIIFTPEPGATPVICKIFRQVHPGLNPDIELQTALADAGLRSVPPPVAAVSAVWRDPRDDGHIVAGSLAFAQEFFPGVADAWRVALGAAAAGTAFAAPARELGAAVAATHAALARLFPTREATAQDRARAAAAWKARLAGALDAVPALAGSVPSIQAAFARAQEAAWPRLQRVHGDLHLGQVLDVPGRGWVLLDFEGEPLRAISERHEPDSAVRDVAGMLRSFAYVAASVPAAPGIDPRAWADAARAAFLDGYASSPAAAPLDPALLRAFELDKALYETVYEARNRPDWVHIPLAAVQRMAAA